jgi:hypothetical protein
VRVEGEVGCRRGEGAARRSEPSLQFPGQVRRGSAFGGRNLKHLSELCRARLELKSVAFDAEFSVGRNPALLEFGVLVFQSAT